jgi:hypothetical protein
MLACLLEFSGSLGASAPPVHLACVEAAELMVVLNLHTLKYHDPSCIWAHRCTQHCIVVPLAEAIRRGGLPCKVCGGFLGGLRWAPHDSRGPSTGAAGPSRRKPILSVSSSGNVRR